MNILLIEPDAVVAESVSGYLEASSHTVDAVVGAAEAVVQCDAKRPDIVVVELALGAHSGIEFLHEFRSYNEWATIPVIVFTMQHLDATDALQKLHVQRYLYKPKTSLKKLLETINEFSV